MVYDATWRTSSYPDFCRSITQLAQYCATAYVQQHSPAPQSCNTVLHHADDALVGEVRVWPDSSAKN